MENIAENAAAETEEKEGVYIAVTEEDLQAMLQAAAKEAIKELRKEEAKEKKKNKYHDTFSLMRCYSEAGFYTQNTITACTQIQLENIPENQQEIHHRS